MRVLITGGNGFVGEAIIKKLLEEKFEVWVLLNENSDLKPDSLIKNKCHIIRADIRKPFSIGKFSDDVQFDALIHSAGLAHQFGKRAEKDFWDINVVGTENVLEAAVKSSIKQFVLISSVAVYGNSSAKKSSKDSKGLNETAECSPEGIYAVTKFEAETIAVSVCERNNLSLTVLRLATVIGENDRGNVFRLIETIAKRRFLWIGNGRNHKSLIYKGDVARACAEVLKFPKKKGIFNLSADAVTMKEIVSEIYAALKRKNSELYIPANVLLNFLRFSRRFSKNARLEKLTATINKWVSDEVFSGEKFQKEFNFKTSTSISEAIEKEVRNYLQSR